MSHLEVAVITKEIPTPGVIEEKMSPFYQDLEVEPYVCADYATVKKELRWYADNMEEEYRRTELQTALDKDDIGTIRYYNKIVKAYEDVDANGNAISTSNPDARWDYYTIYKDCNAYGMLSPYMKVQEVPRVVLTKPDEELMEMFPKVQKSWVEYKYPRDTFAEYLPLWLPWAVVTDDGEWIERDDKETNVQWNDRYNRILNRMPCNYYVTIVNIHR